MVPDIHKWIKQNEPLEKFKIMYLENLVTFLMILFCNNSSNFKGILNLKFLFLIITFLIFFRCNFLANDCLTISTSGNSGI